MYITTSTRVAFHRKMRKKSPFDRCVSKQNKVGRLTSSFVGRLRASSEIGARAYSIETPPRSQSRSCFVKVFPNNYVTGCKYTLKLHFTPIWTDICRLINVYWNTFSLSLILFFVAVLNCLNEKYVVGDWFYRGVRYSEYLVCNLIDIILILLMYFINVLNYETVPVARAQRQARTYGMFVYVCVNFLVFARRSNVFT